MLDFLLVALIAILLGAAVKYIIRAKKKRRQMHWVFLCRLVQFTPHFVYLFGRMHRM